MNSNKATILTEVVQYTAGSCSFLLDMFIIDERQKFSVAEMQQSLE